MAPPLLTTLLTVAPHLVIQLNDVGARAAVRGRDEAMVRCVEAGLELRYRYDVEICRKRSWWFDSCGDVRSEIATIRYEPVSDVYLVHRDLLGDGSEPSVARFMTASDAFDDASLSMPISYGFLADGEEKLEKSTRRYVRVRGTSRCNEERDRTLSRVTQGLTFGLVKRHQFDSDWQEKKIRD